MTFDDITRGKEKEHSPHWPQILDHSCRILITGDFGSGKTNALLNLKSHLPNTGKICLYDKININQTINC